MLYKVAEISLDLFMVGGKLVRRLGLHGEVLKLSGNSLRYEGLKHFDDFPFDFLFALRLLLLGFRFFDFDGVYRLLIIRDNRRRVLLFSGRVSVKLFAITILFL